MNTQQLTKDSQKKWRNRTSACIHYLTEAARGLNSMIRLDRKAVKLGLEPTYKKGEAAAMVDDIKVRLVALAGRRNRQTK